MRFQRIGGRKRIVVAPDAARLSGEQAEPQGTLVEALARLALAADAR
jgi:hypothetical protein